MAIDVGTDAISVSDPNTNAPLASALLAQVTATPAMYTAQRPIKMPVLVLGVPGFQPLAIACPAAYRLSLGGGVQQEVAPAFAVGVADWRALVEKFGLGAVFGVQRRRFFGKLGRAYLVFAVIAVLALGLFGIGSEVWDIYGYHAGSPTTATITRCVTHSRGGQSCYGTWSLGGQSQTGPIHGVGNNGNAGQSVDVHVNGGTAYTAATGQWTAILPILVGSAFLALIVFGAWRGIKSMFGR